MDRFIKAALASAILLLPTYALAQEQTPTSDTSGNHRHFAIWPVGKPGSLR